MALGSLVRTSMRSIELRGSGRELAIEEDHQAANESGAVVWDAALVLIAYLSQTGEIMQLMTQLLD